MSPKVEIGDIMDIRLQTIVKWDPSGTSEETCDEGICIGIVTSVDTVARTGQTGYSVKWWQLCAMHQEVDPTGTGPYEFILLHIVGQL